MGWPFIAGVTTLPAAVDYDNETSSFMYKAYNGELIGPAECLAGDVRTAVITGDRLALTWDGPTRSLKYSINDVDQGTCFTDVPVPVHAAVCFYGKGREATFSLFKVLDGEGNAIEPAAAGSGAGESTVAPFDPTVSSSTAELRWHNGFRTVSPKVAAHTLAVVSQGFSSGRSTWSFRLDADKSMDEASCFGFTTMPIESKSYSNGKQPMVLRAYSGRSKRACLQ